MLIACSLFRSQRHTVVLSPHGHVLLLLEGKVIAASQLVVHNIAIKSLAAPIEVLRRWMLAWKSSSTHLLRVL